MHGAPVAAALLEAATGLRTSRLPEVRQGGANTGHANAYRAAPPLAQLRDGAGGAVDFLAAAAAGGGFGSAMDALLEDASLGRGWAGVSGCRNPPPPARRVPANTFVFMARPWECSVGALAQRATDPGATAAGARARCARAAAYAVPYAHQFSSLFWAAQVQVLRACFTFSFS